MTTDSTEQALPGMRGAPAAFEAIYAEFGDRIYRFCYRLCGQAADAEDLAQETFLAAFRGQERFAGRSSVTTWLFRIALYRWRAMRALRQPEAVLPAEMRAAGEAAVGEEVERLALEEALAALPDDLREAFLLVKAEGLAYREAAKALDVPQGTVQYRVHAASRRLRSLLTEETEGQEARQVVAASRARREEAGDAV